MKEKIYSIVKSFLAAYALTVSFHVPLQREHYETTLDFLIASVYELLGSYNFIFILVGILAFFCFEKYRLRKIKGSIHSRIVAAFFAVALLLGNSFYETNSWAYCFGSMVNFIKTGVAFCGYYVMFGVIVDFLFAAFENGKICSGQGRFWGKHAFWKTFGILSAVYLPALLLSFPGNLCWDVIGQIEQFTVEGVGFSEHHPLLHTILVGGLTKLGDLVLGSKEAGLFVYMLIQNAMLMTALSATVSVLAKKNVRKEILTGLVILYCISPIYSNLSGTAIKDIPFTSFVIGYIICFSLLLEKPQLLHNVKFVVLFVAVQIGTIFMRNNGLPLVLLCGVGGVIFLWKKYNRKERIGSILTMVLTGVLISKLVMTAVAALLGAKAGGKAEMFSLPMQQTARYLVYYGDELSTEERTGIEGIFGPVETVAGEYNPDTADPVKKLFDNEAPMQDVLAYFKAWFIGLCKHPFVYVEAFIQHVYGWFTPGVTNAIRYETYYEPIQQGMLFPMADKVMIFLYRFMDRIPMFGVLQNAGFYVWCLAVFTAYEAKKKSGTQLMTTLPLWISLLVCMASPCFFQHPRYALPIIMGIPFVFVFGISRKERLEEGKK